MAVRDEWAVHPRGDTATVSLADIPLLLEAFFDLEPGSIGPKHPYVWWKRSRDNLDISVPMPRPVSKVGNSHGWTQDAILHWYAAWKGLKVPVCPEAGDRVDSHGRTIPSRHRRGF